MRFFNNALYNYILNHFNNIFIENYIKNMVITVMKY